MLPLGFEPTISAGERPQTYALDRAATATGRDLYLKTQNHNRKTSTSPMGFEPTISAGERPQTYALDHAATGTGDYEFSGEKPLGDLVEKWFVSSLVRYLL